jgi:hypothetical protein
LSRHLEWAVIIALAAAASGCGPRARGAERPGPQDARCDQPLAMSEEAAVAASGIDRTTLIAAMAQARPAVIGCYHEYARPGVANVRVEVAPSGLVDGALVCGELAGTKEGRCIEHSLRKFARFPTLKAPLTFDFPYQLRGP